MASLDRFPAVRELAESCHTDLPWAFAHPPRDQTVDAHFSSLRAHNSPIHKRKERSISPPSALTVPTTGASGACGSEIAGPWKTQTCNAAPFASSGQCPPPLVFVADCPHDCAADSWRFAEYATPRDVFRPLPDDFRQRSAAAAAAAAMRETGAGAAAMTPESLEVRSLASEIPPTFWEAQQAQKQQRPHTVPRTGVPYFRSSSGSSRRAPGSPLGGDGISKNRAGNALGRARAQLQGARGSRSLAARALLHGSARERSGKRGGFDDGAVINGGDAAASAATGTSSPLPSRKFLARTFSGSVEWPSRLESLFMRPGSAAGGGDAAVGGPAHPLSPPLPFNPHSLRPSCRSCAVCCALCLSCSLADILEYVQWPGMELPEEEGLLWVAQESTVYIGRPDSSFPHHPSLCLPPPPPLSTSPLSPTDILEYAQWLGMELPEEEELLWVARQGLKAPLPPNWKPWCVLRLLWCDVL
ncbi:unnamed protein product [Closterium sp. NIES-54]